MHSTDVLNFKVHDVAKAYTSTVQADRLVHAAGIYSGPLSEITLPMAEYMAKTECDLLTAQTAGKSVAATPPKSGEEKKV